MTVVTFDPTNPLWLDLLIGLLLSVIAGGIWSTRTQPHRISWLTTHDGVMGGLPLLR